MTCVRCPRTATRGLFSAALCAAHGPDAPLAPGVTVEDERAAVAADDAGAVVDTESGAP